MNVTLPVVEVGDYVAGRFRIEDLSALLRGLTKTSSINTIMTPLGDVTFVSENSAEAHVVAFDERGRPAYERHTTLTIEGGGTTVPVQPDFNWQLRANTTPYSDIGDLAQEYGFGPLPVSGSLIQVEAYNVGLVTNQSEVQNGAAKIIVRTSAALARSKIIVGVKIMSDNNSISRKRFGGDAFNFEPALDVPGVLEGVVALEVPTDAVLHCFLSYDGLPLHAYYVTAANSYPSPTRTLLEVFDPDLSRTKEALEPLPLNSRSSTTPDDFENACTALLWLLGFAPYRLAMGKLKNAPDILARSASGNIFVVECSVSTFSSDKRAKLLKRTAEVRTAIARSWATNANVLPLMITLESRATLQTQLAEIKNERIVAICSDDLKFIVESRTAFPQNSDAIFEELEMSLKA